MYIMCYINNLILLLSKGAVREYKNAKEKPYFILFQIAAALFGCIGGVLFGEALIIPANLFHLHMCYC